MLPTTVQTTMQKKHKEPVAIVDWLIGGIDSIQRLFTEAAWRLAPIAIVLGPIGLMSVSFYLATADKLGWFAAALIGFCVGLGLEMVGLGSAKAAIRFLMDAQDEELKEYKLLHTRFATFAILGSIFYVGAAIVSIIILEQGNFVLQVIGVLLYLLAPIAYFINGMMNFAALLQVKRETAAAQLAQQKAQEQNLLASESEESRKIAAEEREFNRLMAIKKADAEAELAKIAAQEQAKLQAHRDELRAKLALEREETKRTQIALDATPPAAPILLKKGKSDLTQDDWAFIREADYKAVMAKFGAEERTARRWVKEAQGS